MSLIFILLATLSESQEIVDKASEQREALEKITELKFEKLPLDLVSLISKFAGFELDESYNNYVQRVKFFYTFEKEYNEEGEELAKREEEWSEITRNLFALRGLKDDFDQLKKRVNRAQLKNQMNEQAMIEAKNSNDRSKEGYKKLNKAKHKYLCGQKRSKNLANELKEKERYYDEKIGKWGTVKYLEKKEQEKDKEVEAMRNKRWEGEETLKKMEKKIDRMCKAYEDKFFENEKNNPGPKVKKSVNDYLEALKQLKKARNSKWDAKRKKDIAREKVNKAEKRFREEQKLRKELKLGQGQQTFDWDSWDSKNFMEAERDLKEKMRYCSNCQNKYWQAEEKEDRMEKNFYEARHLLKVAYKNFMEENKGCLECIKHLLALNILDFDLYDL